MSHKKELKAKCRHCGRCCIVWDPIRYIWHDCPFLLHYVTGSTRCAIYPHRIGVIIGKNQCCNRRIDTTFNIPLCPYNKPDQKTHDSIITSQLSSLSDGKNKNKIPHQSQKNL